MSVRTLIAKFEALAATTAARATSSYRSSSDIDVRAHIQHYEPLRRSIPIPTEPTEQDQTTSTLATPPRTATLSSSSVPAVEKVQLLLSHLDVVIINASLARPEAVDAHTYKPASAPAPTRSAATTAPATTTTPAFNKVRCQVDDQSTQTNTNGSPASAAAPAVPAPMATLPRLAAIQLLPTQAVLTSAPARFGIPRRCLKAVKSRLSAFREDPKFLQQCAESRQRRTELATTKLPAWRR